MFGDLRSHRDHLLLIPIMNRFDQINDYVNENLLPIVLGFALVEVVYSAFLEASFAQ